METLQLRLDFAGVEGSEEALLELQAWLGSQGFRVETFVEPPAEKELGGKGTALILIFSLTSESAHLPPAVEEGLQAIQHWREQPHAYQELQPVIYLTDPHQAHIAEIIREKYLGIHVHEPELPPKEKKHHPVAPPHIELREPDLPPKKEKEVATAPLKPEVK